MGKQKTVTRFSDKKQKHYERVARLQYGAEIVNDSVQRWNSYSKAQQDAIMAEAGEIYAEIMNAMEAGRSPHSSEVQAMLQRWHDNLRNFYEPTLEILRGLGETYKTEPGFITFFQKYHIDLPDYLAEGITHYVDDLEYAEIARMLAEDEAQQNQHSAKTMQMKISKLSSS